MSALHGNVSKTSLEAVVGFLLVVVLVWGSVRLIIPDLKLAGSIVPVLGTLNTVTVTKAPFSPAYLLMFLGSV